MGQKKGETGAYVDVQGPKVPGKGLLLLDADVLEVLAPEHDDAALGEQEGQLVLLEVVQLRELQAADLGADGRSQIGHLEVGVAGVEQVGLLLVGQQAAVDKVERLQRRERGLLVVDRQVVDIFVLGGG